MAAGPVWEITPAAAGPLDELAHGGPAVADHLGRTADRGGDHAVVDDDDPQVVAVHQFLDQDVGAELQGQVDQFVGNAMGNASETDLRTLLTAATRWGIVPDAADLPAAVQVAAFEGAPPQFAPATFGDLLDATLGL